MDIETEEISELRRIAASRWRAVEALQDTISELRAARDAEALCAAEMLDTYRDRRIALADALGADLDTHWDALLAQVRGLV